MKKFSMLTALATLVALLSLGFSPGSVFADGTEVLGPPSIAIASGSGIVAAGVGLVQGQPGTINITVPDGATVNQVLLYWEGQMRGTVAADDSILAAGIAVTGDLIGGPTLFFQEPGGGDDIYSSAFRADITGLGLIGPGPNAVAIDGMDFTFANNGAGILVIFDEGSASDIQVRDGLDLAFFLATPPIDATVAQTFNFAAAGVDRTATLSMFFSSVKGEISGGGFRPNSIEVTVGGVTTVFSNLLGSNDGEEWDTQNLPITIPAGATSLTVQAFSRNDSGPNTDPLAASLGWVAAGLSVPLPEPCIDIEKWVSADGIEFFDADECADALITEQSAEYRLDVCNCGNEDLVNVVINDADLAITDHPVGSLEVGQCVSLLKEDIPALEFPGLCERFAEFRNTATATGEGAFSGQIVQDLDPACVKCIEPPSCRVTAGGNKDTFTTPCITPDNGLTLIQDTCAYENNNAEKISHTWGGQAGAQPAIDCNWSHHYKGPEGNLGFHSNKCFYIECSDPGEDCPAADGKPETRQIDFSGKGRFTHKSGDYAAFPDHDLCFMVHLEDIGEPGRGGRRPNAEDPCTHCPGTAIENVLDCDDCTDYYQIVIYDSASPDPDPSTGKCSGDPLWFNGGPVAGCPDSTVIAPQPPYDKGSFIRAGNVQMHQDNNGAPIFNSEVFCDNGIDDDGDRKVDCVDKADCKNDPACQ